MAKNLGGKTGIRQGNCIFINEMDKRSLCKRSNIWLGVIYNSVVVQSLAERDNMRESAVKDS